MRVGPHIAREGVRYGVELIDCVDTGRAGVTRTIGAQQDHLTVRVLHPSDEQVRPAPSEWRHVDWHHHGRVAAWLGHVSGPAEGCVLQQAVGDAAPRPDRHTLHEFGRPEGWPIAAIGAPDRGSPCRLARGDGGEHVSFASFVALVIDEEALVGKGREDLFNLGDETDAGAAQRVGAPTIGGVAVADIHRLQICEVAFSRDAGAVGAAVEGPVMDDRQMAISRRVDVEFDNVGARRKGRPHRRERVLHEPVGWRENALGGAGLVGEAVAGKGLVDAAMRDQLHAAFGRRDPPGRVPHGDRDHDDREANEYSAQQRQSPETHWESRGMGWPECGGRSISRRASPCQASRHIRLAGSGRVHRPWVAGRH